VLFSPIKDDKQILEPQEMWEKDETWIWIYKGIYKETYFHIQFYLHFILFDKYNDENDTLFVKEKASYSAIHMGKCKISHYFSKLWFTIANIWLQPTKLIKMIFSHIYE
jgi:hypothetical protein